MNNKIAINMNLSAIKSEKQNKQGEQKHSQIQRIVGVKVVGD